MNADDIRRLIEAGLPDATVAVRGDDGVHFEAEVASASFEGQRVVAQHQLVYRALGPRMGREIHALALKTYTPAQWAARAE